ncbi:hypothetical protein, partial [Nocardia asiatica]
MQQSPAGSTLRLRTDGVVDTLTNCPLSGRQLEDLVQRLIPIHVTQSQEVFSVGGEHVVDHPLGEQLVHRVPAEQQP